MSLLGVQARRRFRRVLPFIFLLSVILVLEGPRPLAQDHVPKSPPFKTFSLLSAQSTRRPQAGASAREPGRRPASAGPPRPSRARVRPPRVRVCRRLRGLCVPALLGSRLRGLPAFFSIFFFFFQSRVSCDIKMYLSFTYIPSWLRRHKNLM